MAQTNESFPDLDVGTVIDVEIVSITDAAGAPPSVAPAPGRIPDERVENPFPAPVLEDVLSALRDGDTAVQPTGPHRGIAIVGPHEVELELHPAATHSGTGTMTEHFTVTRIDPGSLSLAPLGDDGD
ncbi:hypothetical protein [Microbacterium immunditiarum]|uniref:Uncharacterized protein n=1 Tax=Microbacterium immunditiarum TaxID=337480 RepID=A0A7Y9KGR0_9MICO|nr:hypothetical protein [Microbacterium immunditiarum]NYE18742.1 hypothetical protein [Microbacterium immunditiarum]